MLYLRHLFIEIINKFLYLQSILYYNELAGQGCATATRAPSPVDLLECNEAIDFIKTVLLLTRYYHMITFLLKIIAEGNNIYCNFFHIF